MYDMKPLEEKWKQYRKKKLRPWYIGTFLFMLSFFLVFMIFSQSQINLNFFSFFSKKFNYSSLEESKSNNISTLKSNIVINGPLSGLEVEKQIIADSDTGTVEDAHEDSLPNILVDIPVLDGNDEETSDILSKPRKKVHLDIIKTTNMTAYKDVENRFKQSHDIDDSLFLARSYYKKGNYKKAEFWALETNKVDSNVEEGMLIFVKSKMKLGRKNEARNILTRYIKESNSQEAKKLLYSIENGKF